jgi:hypothetical protein
VKHAVEMGDSALIYIPSFIEIGSGIQKLKGGIYRHRQQGDLIELIMKESILQAFGRASTAR